MNFQTRSNQLYVLQKSLMEIKNDTREYSDMRRNKLYMPPLMPIRSVTGKVNNSMHFMTEPQVAPACKYDKNRGASEVSIQQQSIPKVNKMESPTTVNYFDKRIRANIPQSILEMSVQDNPGPIASSTFRTTADSVAAFNVAGRSNAVPKRNSENAENNSFNFKIFGSTENEKMFIFTGTVERVIKWNKIFQNHFCYYEVIASVVSIQEGSVNTQKIMLLRDRKGPILQVIYYNTTHIDIKDFHVEQVLRCLGKMSSPNILNAVSIRNADQEEVETLQRHCLACDQAISHFLNV